MDNQEAFNIELDRRVEQIMLEIADMDETTAKHLVYGPEKTELEQRIHNHRTTIALAGNIGFGKSTAAKIIGEKGRARVFEEDTANPLLAKYYEDMKAYGLALQVNLSDTRLFDMVMNRQRFPTEPLIYDRSHYEDPFIFAEALHKSGLMREKDRDLCQWYFRMRKEQLENHFGIRLTPDLIVLLTGNLREGWKRARERNRGMEMRKDAKKGVGLTIDFYRALQAEYGLLRKVLQTEYGGVVLTLPQSRVDVSDISNPKGQLYVMRGTLAALRMMYDKAA